MIAIKMQLVNFDQPACLLTLEHSCYSYGMVRANKRKACLAKFVNIFLWSSASRQDNHVKVLRNTFDRLVCKPTSDSCLSDRIPFLLWEAQSLPKIPDSELSIPRSFKATRTVSWQPPKRKPMNSTSRCRSPSICSLRWWATCTTRWQFRVTRSVSHLDIAIQSLRKVGDSFLSGWILMSLFCNFRRCVLPSKTSIQSVSCVQSARRHHSDECIHWLLLSLSKLSASD